MSSSDERLAAALEYARAGWPIIPLHTPTGNAAKPCSCNRADCKSVGKHPRTLNGVKGATTDEAVIRRWWTQWPAANIGGALGAVAGRFAVDIDPRNGGNETLDALRAKHGDLPATLTQLTGSDGYHYLFRHPPGARLRGELGAGIDIKSDGGYIVLAPSLHASGKRYEWLTDAPVADAPAWMLDALRKRKTDVAPSGAGEEYREGTRHNALLSLAGSMRRRGMAPEEIEAALLVVNERRCDPPLDPAEVRQIAASMGKYQPEPPPEPPDWLDDYPAPDYDPAPPKPPEAAAKALAAEGYGDPPQSKHEKDAAPLAVSWAEFDAEQFPQGERIAFAVERGEIALINALPNAGKTTLALNVAVCLAAGRPFAPVAPERKIRRVLYIDGETRRARLQRDLRTMTRGLSREEAIAVGKNLHIICEAEIKAESLALTRTDHLLQLSGDALRVKPDLIIIDTLSSLCPVFNENDNAEQTRRVWRPLQKLARDCDAAILVLHHVGKRSEDSQTPERVYRGRGASASGGAARAVWLLIPDPVTPGLSTLSCVKAKGDCPADARLQLDAKTRWIRTLEAVAPQPTPLEIVIAAVTREMATSEIVAALKGRFGARSVKTYLAEAVELGKLRKVKQGVYAPESAESAESANGQNAQPAQPAQPKKEIVQVVQTSIGAAQPAQSRKANKARVLRANAESATDMTAAQPAQSRNLQKSNGFGESAESATLIEVCTTCTIDGAGQASLDQIAVEREVIEPDAAEDGQPPQVWPSSGEKAEVDHLREREIFEV